MNPSLSPAFWLDIYPDRQLYPFARVFFGVSGYQAEIVARAGDGRRVLGLARIFVAGRESAMRYAAARQNLDDATPCSHCGHPSPHDRILTTAHHRTANNPLGAYGCLRCTQIPGAELNAAALAECAAGDSVAPASTSTSTSTSPSTHALDPFDEIDDLGAAALSASARRARARRVLSISTPAAAMAELALIHPDPRRAYRALIRLHIELSGPPPVIRRLAGVNPTATLTTQE